MPDDLSPSLDDLADPKDGSRLSDYAQQMSRHLRGNPNAGPGKNPAQAFLDWRNSGQSWSDQMGAAMNANDLSAQAKLMQGFAGSADVPGWIHPELASEFSKLDPELQDLVKQWTSKISYEDTQKILDKVFHGNMPDKSIDQWNKWTDKWDDHQVVEFALKDLKDLKSGKDITWQEAHDAWKTIDSSKLTPAQKEKLSQLSAAGFKEIPGPPTIGPKLGALAKSEFKRNPNPEMFMPHFKTLDWKDKLPPEASPHDFESVGFPTPEQMNRAQQQGYNINFPLYKGGEKGYFEKFPDPATKEEERALFFSDKENVAKKYGSVSPYIARAEKPMTIHWPTATGDEDYSSAHMHAMLEAARKMGIDMLEIQDIRDMGGKQSQYAVLHPRIMRAPDAKFDPAMMQHAMPLAGLAGGAIMLDQYGNVIPDRKDQ